MSFFIFFFKAVEVLNQVKVVFLKLVCLHFL